MISQIITAIAAAINHEFNAHDILYEIYVDEIMQGLREPCFFIQCLNPTIQRYPSMRYKRDNFFCVQYFPANTSGRSECMKVAERLIDCLECIRIIGDGDSVSMRGTGMKYEITDGVMSFFVNYNCFVLKNDPEERMGTLRNGVRTK